MSHKPHQSYHRVSVEHPVDGRWQDMGWREPLVNHDEGHPTGQPHRPHAAVVDTCGTRQCVDVSGARVSSHEASRHPSTFSDAFAADHGE